MSALQQQIAGDHYTKMRMQPIELAYYLHASPCFCKLAKYLTRDKGNRLEDLKKALHVIRLEKELYEKCCEYETHRFTDDGGAYTINEFSDNFVVRAALEYMYIGDHDRAVEAVKFLISLEFPNEVVDG